MLNPKTRNIVQLQVSDPEETEKLLEMFMGKDTKDRKIYIEEHSEEAIE